MPKEWSGTRMPRVTTSGPKRSSRPCRVPGPVVVSETIETAGPDSAALRRGVAENDPVTNKTVVKNKVHVLSVRRICSLLTKRWYL